MRNVDGNQIDSFTWTEETASWSWHAIVCRALQALGGFASLKALYALIESHPRTHGKKHWKARVRAALEGSSTFVWIETGNWALSAQYSSEQVAEHNRRRRERYPLLGPRKKAST